MSRSAMYYGLIWIGEYRLFFTLWFYFAQ